MASSSPWFRKLPGFRRSPPGLEWQILRRLPAILAGGLALAFAFGASAHALVDAPSPEAQKLLELAHAYAAGAVLLHLALVGTLALACFIVYVMKGPAYVADAYALPEEDQPARAKPRRADE